MPPSAKKSVVVVVVVVVVVAVAVVVVVVAVVVDVVAVAAVVVGAVSVTAVAAVLVAVLVLLVSSWCHRYPLTTASDLRSSSTVFKLAPFLMRFPGFTQNSACLRVPSQCGKKVGRFFVQNPFRHWSILTEHRMTARPES